MQPFLISPNDYFLVSEIHTCWDRCLSDRHILLSSVGGFLVKFCHFLWRQLSHQGWFHASRGLPAGLLHSRMFDGFRQRCAASFPWRNVFLLTVLSSQPSVTMVLLVYLFPFVYHYISWKRPFPGLGVQLSVAHLSRADRALDSIPSTTRKQKQTQKATLLLLLILISSATLFSGALLHTCVLLLCFPLRASSSSFTWHPKLPIRIHWAPANFPSSVDSLIYPLKPNQHNSHSGIIKFSNIHPETCPALWNTWVAISAQSDYTCVRNTRLRMLA